MSAFFILLLLGSLLATAWVLFIKARGELNYWIRPFRAETQWVIGKQLDAQPPAAEDQKILMDLNSVLRNHSRRTDQVCRIWRRDEKSYFVGLMLRERPDFEVDQPFEIRELPARSFLRVSGSNRQDELTPVDAMKAFAQRENLQPDLTEVAQLSGQSFSLLQWPLVTDVAEPSPFAKFSEWTLRLRDILVFPVLLTLVSLGLVGFKQPVLFGVGIILIIFLSGACKFVFLYRQADEAEESHLQGY
ncbi:MAG: hypothetical protein Q7Q71_10505 [Verrucomicrobiota bacterium JB023]|nr:hypothetical protein [Verrucomicrobiota bacterium JB023]